MPLAIFLLSLLQFLTGDDVTLVFAGDAMQHDSQIKAAQKGEKYDYSVCFRYISDYVSAADYAVVNFEVSLGGKPYKGYPCFSAPDEYALALKDAGFDLFLHANNHCLDRRDAGLVRTLDKLDEYGIPHIGTYRNSAEQQKQIPYIANVKGMNIAFLNYTYGTNGIRIQKDVRVNYIDKAKIKADLEATRRLSPDLIVVCMHWGVEYVLLQNKEQESLADFLINEGVDLVIGGHPHVIQPMEIRRSEKYNKDALVIYSLGNLISAMKITNSVGGALARVVITKEDGRAIIKSANYKLVYVQAPDADTNFQLIPADRPDLLRPDSKAKFKGFTENARKIFNKYNKNVTEDTEIPIFQYKNVLEFAE